MNERQRLIQDIRKVDVKIHKLILELVHITVSCQNLHEQLENEIVDLVSYDDMRF